jgi:hypothetical protein
VAVFQQRQHALTPTYNGTPHLQTLPDALNEEMQTYLIAYLVDLISFSGMLLMNLAPDSFLVKMLDEMSKLKDSYL